ncbi:Seed linoleate 9S-lipoxygenase-2 [Glycine max]|nr:Seed linoleate 9S-lipoxygenase-2 [Glycine max]
MSSMMVKGKVVLIRKYVLQTISNAKELVGNGFNLIGSSVEYDITKSVFFNLISRTKSSKDNYSKDGKEACLENNASVLRSLGGKEEEFDIYFEWDATEMGIPGAFYVKNHMKDEFFLVSMTLEYPLPTCDRHKDKNSIIHFLCNSWVHNHGCYKTHHRIFFDNNPYLPGNQTPEALRKYREEELDNLRGDGTGERKEWDRIYDYDVYNDLGYLDSDEKDDHPILGGTLYPYPRRCFKKFCFLGHAIYVLNVNIIDLKFLKGGKYEKPADNVIYVPRDENFSLEKTTDFLEFGKKSLSGKVEPLLLSLYLKLTPNEFNGFEEVQRLYDQEGGIKLPISTTMGTENVLKFPTPHVIQASTFAWMTDEEFAREMIAGVNPNVIRLLKREDLAPRRRLDCKCNHSTITKEKLEINMGGVTVDEAFCNKRLFILDYYDAFMPYLRKINELDSAKAYATRTFLFLKDDGTLKPLAIELSKPHQCVYVLPHPPHMRPSPFLHYYFPSQVVLPADKGDDGTIWLLAKAYVVVNDTNYHQLISHWLHTHAVMEPFSIATHRQLSVLHPIYKLLHPHFRDTININALARQSLINAGSIIEQTFLPGKYSMEMSSAVYKNWVFTDQALPTDLIKRGLAVKDHTSPHGLRLMIKDYPYAVDGLEIWDAIKTWVQEYVNLYYSNDKAVEEDTELQAWWKEVVEKGHGDLKDNEWPIMKTCQELIDSCTIIIWIGSALHAAVNFGQYPYGGYILNRPTQSRRLLPEPKTKEYDEMVKNPQEAFLRTITPKFQTVIDLTVMEILSSHSSDEIYLGQRDTPNWTSDQNAKDVFETFTKTLAEIEKKISERNNNQELKNRTGPAKFPYTVLLPTSEPGVLEKVVQQKPEGEGEVVLMRKNVLDFNNLTSVVGIVGTSKSLIGSAVDGVTSLMGKSVCIQLISATKADANGNGIVGKKAYLEGIIASIPTLGAGQSAFNINFKWDSDMGIPGAFIITNHMNVEFFLVSLTLEDIPNQGTMNFVCNSWVYNYEDYKQNRIFFVNETYVPSETPGPLVTYREAELQALRGNGTGKRKEWDRVYDYDVYNDLGNPDSGENFARPVLGGSLTHPYPRRGRTDSKSEKPGHVYVPRDEIFGHLKSSDFLSYGIKSLSRSFLPAIKSIFDLKFTPNEFGSFEEVRELCEGGIKLPTDILSKMSPLPVLKEIFRTDGEDNLLKFSIPHLIKVNKSAWMTDDEFAREMIAGVNPCVIRLLQAIEGQRLFILDHHDVFMPFLTRLNESKSTKAYATRTILFLKDDGTLKPLAIELSLPHSGGQHLGADSKVILPANQGVESTIWLLAKAYVVVNDSCYHQLISHWLNTHAVIEPFVIATNRNLSVLHPVYKLLFPHYRDTMNINALARQSLINADGIIEQSFLGGKYSMEISSEAYKAWVFPDQALPADLIKRGMATEDSSCPNGLRLVIEDYPYAVDGLEIWDAIKTWVQEYVSLYYATDDAVKKDSELQAWWKEVVEKGHGDLKDKPWWPKMQTLQELIQSCSTIIWIASALHAAVNFGQYPYGGFILNRPTLSRRLIPEKGTPEYDEMVKSHQKAY